MSQRVRTKTASSTTIGGSYYYMYCGGSVSNPFNPRSAIVSDGYSKITDEQGSSRLICGSSHRQRMKAVTHQKWEYDPVSNPWQIPWAKCSGKPSEAGFVRFMQTPPLGSFISQCSGYSAGNPTSVFTSKLSSYLTDLDPSYHHDERWKKCKPSMATRANMAVFLAELRDVKRMFDLIPGKHFNLSNWTEVARYGNSLHLNYNFGWKPFISDLKSAWKGLSTFEQRLAKFLDSQNLDLTCRWGDKPISAGTESGYFSPTLDYQAFRYKYKIDVKTKFSSTFQFSYTLPPFDYQSMRWRAYLDTLGLAANAANVWELIPWSFVIDWFVDVGSYLEQFSDDWIEPWIYFCQACSSVKREAKITYILQYQAYGFPVTDFARYTDTLYSRSVGIPRVALSSPAELSSDKIRLLVSLGASRIL